MPDSAPASAAESFTPKLVSQVLEGYGHADLRKDAVAGLTVAIVALPLSIAIAIASGVSPDRGLYAAIIGGFLVSALGGSRFQIGGPAGAFIVLVAATVRVHGIDGLLLAVLMSGLMLTALGLSRLGGYIRHIPHPVVIGFTAGIGATIFASQIKDFAGLTFAGAEPGPTLEKLAAIGAAVPTLNPAALALAAFAAAVIVAFRRWRPTWPGMLIAVVASTAIAAALHLPVDTIGSRFGDLPAGLPSPRLPTLSLERILTMLPAALSFTVLGGLESLLSAMVADGMTGRRHRSNIELAAQGVANVGSALFGGISVTGTIARTATNVRAGARSPISGMLHAAFLLAFLLVAAPLASYVPVCVLAGLLMVVAWNMVERPAFAALLKDWRSALVLLTTFGLTVVHDLMTGILAGCAVAAAIWLFSRGSRRLTP